MRRKLNSLFHRAYRAFTERVVSGVEIGKELDINALISPLRYDILIRIRFIRELTKNQGLYEKDLGAFLQLRAARDYYTWFKHVPLALYRPELGGNDQLIQPLFVDRVHRTVNLWSSIQRRGFDLSQRIRLASGTTVRVPNGKQVLDQFFAGDGCHRLACLYALGLRRLEPKYYDVVVVPVLEPIDSTSILRGALPISDSEYLRFLSRRYWDGREVRSPEELCQHVAKEFPGSIAELRSILAADRVGQ